MYRIAIPALLLAFAASSNAEAAGLNLNNSVAKLTGKIPVIDNLVTSKGLALPVLGKLPGVNLTLGKRFVLLGGVNVADLLNGIDVGASGTQYAGQLGRQVQKEIDLFR
ncbi:MAG: hypothetical protein JWQ90_4337 [Hydrocarboniphaga sp.]|uniref:hypothetical protein n=1 Tax=Hydrocarboniphaga sp. TaxID=2033016 RepID=UPI00262AFFE0|nr:hypothetical protein [Hydrocarboniphaga sp.]MDB5971887.1 hypothetical protein [Hydrocarboniphaga sp.]